MSQEIITLLTQSQVLLQVSLQAMSDPTDTLLDYANSVDQKGFILLLCFYKAYTLMDIQ